jgi:hypothetical protein
LEWWEGHPDIFPPDPDLEPLHERQYQVRAWRIDDDSILLRGAVMDLRPGGPIARRLAAAGGSDDGRPLTMHHMIVDLTVGFPDLTINQVDVRFEANPQPGCPSISAHYRELIGISIARGFTHKVRELFGGPRGCTHTTALLQAMGPVAVQCFFPMRGAGPGRNKATTPARPPDPSQVQSAMGESSFMKGTCHVWAEDGDIWQGIQMGRIPAMALPMQDRVRDSGLDPDQLDIRGQ